MLRIGRDAGRDRDVSAVLALGVGDALDDRLRDREAFVLVAARQEERELVSSEPERLAALAEARGDLREHTIADRVAEAIVDLLEIVDVEQAEGQRDAALLCLVEVALQPLVEVPVVPEPGQRVGEREAHGLEGAVHRALVEGDRDERAHERDGEERRALPEHREHEADRRHDRERHRSPVDGLAKQRHERLTRPPRDDRGDQRDVHRVERRRGEQHLQEERGDSRLPRSHGCGETRRAAAQRVDRAVVGQADCGAALEQLDERPGEEAHHDRRRPAVDHGGADDEDGRERDSLRRDPLDRDRVRLDEGRRQEECEHSGEDFRLGIRCHESPDGEREHGEAREGHRDDDGQKPRRLARDETTLRLHPTRCALGRANGAQAHGYDLTVRRATRPTLQGRSGKRPEGRRQLQRARALPSNEAFRSSPVFGRVGRAEVSAHPGSRNIPPLRDSEKPAQTCNRAGFGA